MSDFWPEDFLKSLNPESLERNEEIAVIGDIVKVRNEASSMGLLVIESFAENEEFPEFFRIGLKMIADGTDPDEVFRVLFEKLESDAEDAKKTMKNALYLQGVLSIQEGESPELTASRIGVLMGVSS
jgi:flagellar motor component MotA